MPSTIQVGTVLIDDSPAIAQIFGLQSEACSGNWSVVNLLDGFALPQNPCRGMELLFHGG
jgi:hypothetical protein